MSFNDIREDLDENIDLASEFPKRKIKTSKLHSLNTDDIVNNLPEIDIKWKKYISIYKRKSINFDGIIRVKKKKLKTINLVKKSLNIEEKISFIKEKIKPNKKYIQKKQQDILANIEKINFHNKLKISIPVTIKKAKFPIIDKVKRVFSSKNTQKYMLILASILLFLFTFKLTLESSVHSGYNRIIALKEKPGNFQNIKKQLNNAKFDFILSELMFQPFLLIPNDNIKNGYHIIQWWKAITKLWDDSLNYFSEIKKLIDSKGVNDIYFTQLLLNSKDQFRETQRLLWNALFHYDQISNLNNTELEQKLHSAVLALKKAISYMDTINRNYSTALNLLWHSAERKYLFVFQNNDEIRPTGWFMWSVAMVSVFRWKIKYIDKSDIYAYEWNINKILKPHQKQKAPEWLHKITGTYGLRDANYEPLIEDSAHDIKLFLDTIDVDVDGIVFINKWTIEKMLNASGWIYFDKLGMTIDGNNFSSVISTLVEAKTFKEGTLGSPKQILFDFAEEFYKSVQKDKNYSNYMKVILNEIQTRDLMVYSFRPEENSLLWKLWLNGKIDYKKYLDFSYPVYTSISGNKSDRYIEHRFQKTVNFDESCNINTSLKIYQAHYFTTAAQNEIQNLLDKYEVKNQDHIMYIQWRWRNYQYMRVLLPNNAKITPKPWLRVIDKKDYKIAEFYIKTERLEVQDFTIDYQLKNPDCQPYNYKQFKQPGINSYDMKFKYNNEDIIEADSVWKDFVIFK